MEEGAVARRLLDLRELRVAAVAQLDLLDARAAAAERRLEAAAAEIIAALRAREAELHAALRDDCEGRRAQLRRVIAEIDDCTQRLCQRNSRNHDNDNEYEQEEDYYNNDDNDINMKSREAWLRESAFFDVPRPVCYTVTSRPIMAERHLTLLQEPAPSFIPSALTVPITDNSVYLPLHSETTTTIIKTTKADKIVGSCMVLQDGMLHYIATSGGTKPFWNPIESDAIRVHCNAPIVLGRLSSLCTAVDASRTSTTVLQQQCFRTASFEKARIEFDFGDRRWVDCTAYALRHGHASEHAALRSWRLLGSRDKSHWVVLDEQRRNNTLGASPFNVGTFNIDRECVFDQARVIWHCGTADTAFCAFRYLALELTGPDAVGEHHIELSGMEFYGALVNTVMDYKSG
ncbi:putative E3 ubiquitin-protein ligase HECTD1-like isoform X6 [Trypanosoma theileri]|uniref:Putative E3 ubiquitin-protein ligase HECTD1-like isoform X6 n=1 Tax=Trypanosoma theileri TaxID=67003 RepID=A0A1X0NR84_9TRYP|nr:putative E3 ubiquitin-protein ligase HECTD1-like isoform X6 [Trypanosoma theileri]ORC87226.1 putative E3 ubiquitin-protein ligase HECTD1-like isoform X6 [Trypanosoma theileri]